MGFFFNNKVCDNLSFVIAAVILQMKRDDARDWEVIAFFFAFFCGVARRACVFDTCFADKTGAACLAGVPVDYHTSKGEQVESRERELEHCAPKRLLEQQQQQQQQHQYNWYYLLFRRCAVAILFGIL
jgi:phosphatidylserine decarboxylase